MKRAKPPLGGPALALLFLLGLGQPASAAPQAERVHSLAPGGLHPYELSVREGELLAVSAEQRGVDLQLRLLSPDGTELLVVDSPTDGWGTEHLSFVAEASGLYRLEVEAFPAPPGTRPGTYALTLEGPRTASPEDRRRGELDGLQIRAEALAGERRAEALQEALGLFQRVADGFAATGRGDREAYGRERMGGIARLLGRGEEALAALERALELHTATGDLRGQARTSNQIALVHGSRGDPAGRLRAEGAYRQALELYEALGDPAAAARVENNRGLLHHQAGDLTAAREAYEGALERFVEAGDTRRTAIALNNLGSVYQALGRPGEAFERYDRALELARRGDDLRRQAEIWNNRGLAHDELGEAQEALDAYRRALDLFRRLGDRRREGRALVNLAALERDLGRPQEALALLELALPGLEAVEDVTAQAAALGHRSRAHEALGQPRDALEAARAAVALTEGAEDLPGLAAASTVLGALLATPGSPDSPESPDSDASPETGLAHLDRALALRRSLGDPAGEALTLLARGEARGSLGRPGARPDLEAALELARRTRARRTEARALVALARLDRRAGEPAAAWRHLEPALELIETLRAGVAGAELRMSYLAHRREAYELAIGSLLDLAQAHPEDGWSSRALLLAERARSRALVDLLREARVDLRGGADASPEIAALVERERRLRLQLSGLPREGNENQEDQESEAGLETADLLEAYRRVRADLRAASPRAAALADPVEVRLSRLQEDDLGEGTLLLEYFLGTRESYLWTVTSQSVEAHRLPPGPELEALARQAHQRLSVRDPGARQAQARALRDLSHQVLGPAAHLLGGAGGAGESRVTGETGATPPRRLLVVPDGALELIPFAVLPSPTTGTPLLDHHPVIHLPSAGVLTELRRRTRPRAGGPPSLALIYDPVFSPEDARMPASAPGSPPGAEGGARDESPIPGRLPWTSREARAIAEQASAAGSGPWTVHHLGGFAARRSAVAGPSVATAEIVHFATHGLGDPVQPELAGLALSRFDEAGRPIPGDLLLPDVYALELAARLVVLSGCGTATGPRVRSEGLLALTRGFFYAGAPQVVASLWSVDDRATAELMERFYRALLVDGRPAAAALRDAQRSMAREPGHEDPYLWGAFILQGDWTADARVPDARVPDARGPDTRGPDAR